MRHQGQAVAVALKERAVPYPLSGATAFFTRAEVRDVIAWLRAAPATPATPAGCCVLARLPIGGAWSTSPCCVQIARLLVDMVGAPAAATQSPTTRPQAREPDPALPEAAPCGGGRAGHHAARPVRHRLVDRLGLRRQQLFAAQADVVEALVSLAQLGDLATAHVRRDPQATGRDFARAVTAVAEAGLHDEEEDPEAGTRQEGAWRRCSRCTRPRDASSGTSS